MKRMNNSRLWVVFLLLLGLLRMPLQSAFAQDNPAFLNRVKQGLTAFVKAVNAGDGKAMGSLLPPDFSYTSYYNTRYDRVHFVSGIKERDAIFDTFAVSFKVNKADISGEVGVANATLLTKGTFRDSNGKRHQLEVTETVKLTYAKKNTAWILKSAEATNFQQKVDGKVTH